ncbi:AfsR/SARP family transcriptional regulator [Paractinoplanes lichenicola]|uniref:Winged helix-turn-helix domain-containing protein n=1 Tax=Paractinoplanes lichenicola TaxID=2802976 RepID=A0ABS1W656_9ACTN|nr:AfsR/SARP family transcriptional regulator [Actinoplanes lichenicola]MBL7262202.1 winged helix-turn-helix domain-containing protein [Actinoplanes lichenicola]
MGATPIHLRILGPLRVWRGDVEVDAGPNQQRCLLALLLAREGRPVGMTELIEALWDSEPPPSAVNIVHKYVGLLRRLLEPGLPPRATGSYLRRHGHGYYLTADEETVDLTRFRRLVAEAKSQAGRDEPGVAFDLYAEALRLVHGPAGAELADTLTARSIFAEVDGEVVDAVLAAADLGVRLNRPSRLLTPLRRAAQLDPLNEHVHASLVTTLAAAGHQAEAMATYRSLRGRLADELGVEPGQDMRNALEGALTRVVPAQLPPDLALFAGRTGELAALHRLAATPRTGPLVIALDGPGGVGKSTLALHFAHAVARDFPDGQLYLDLHGKQPAEAVQTLLYGLGARSIEAEPAQAGLYRSLTAGRRLLLVLDNVTDAAQVRPLLPSSARSLVLLTGRSRLSELAVRDGAHLMRVDVPDLAAARALLARRLAALPDEPQGSRLVDEIIELCGRLPLAMVLLATGLTPER